MTMTQDQARDLMRKTTFTLKGRALHPNIITAKKGTKPGDREKFDVQFVWKEGENAETMAKISKFMMEMSQVFHPGVNPAALINPFKKFDTYIRQDGKPNGEHLRGCIWINPSTGKDYPPQVVKQGMNGALVQLTPADEAEAYSGRNAVINIQFYVQMPKPEVGSHKRGFGLNFNAVMLLEGGERVGAGPVAVDANAVFGEFASEMGVTPEAATTSNNPFGSFV